MAILINKELNINNLKIESCYINLSITDNVNYITVEPSYFKNKSDYLINSNIPTPYFHKILLLDYDKSTDGDILLFGHNMFFKYLTEKIITKTTLNLIDQSGNTRDLSNITISNNNGITLIKDSNNDILFSVNEYNLSFEIVDNILYRTVVIRHYFDKKDVSIVDLN